MVILPFLKNPYNGHINPYYWVDDHPLLYGNNGSLDPSTDHHVPWNEFTPQNCQSKPLKMDDWKMKNLPFGARPTWQVRTVTLPKTNSSPLKIGLPKRKFIFQPSIFRGELLVSRRSQGGYLSDGLFNHQPVVIWNYPPPK